MIKKLRPYLSGYERAALLSPLLIILEVLCELFLPRMMAAIVDVGIPTEDLPFILKQGGWMLILAVISLACGVYAAKFASVASQGFAANLRKGLFDRIQTFSFADIDYFSSASLITRTTNDVNALQMMLAMGLRILVRAPVMLIASLIMTIYLNAKLSLVLFVVIPVLVAAIAILMKVSTKLFTTMQTRIDQLNDDVQENLVAIRVVKAFVRERHERKKFNRANDNLTDAALSAMMRIILVMPIMMICINAAILGVLWLGGQQVMTGGMLVGDLSSFLSYITQIMISIMMVAVSLLQYTRAKACAKRIAEVLDHEPDIKDDPESLTRALPEQQGRLEFRNVSFRYQAGSGDSVLQDVSFTAEPGRFVALVGGTGTGKSSLVNLIPRFYDVTDGAVLVDGMDVRDYPIDALRSRIGMVLQNSTLFSGTIRDNLRWGKEDATEEEIVAAAKAAQAYDFIMSLPDGFDTWIEQGGVNVSGGQKQRLGIARAMLRHPSILILDDATSAVDSATEARIRESFQENLKDTTVLLIAQRISSVIHADQILVLEDGVINGSGTHEELLANNKIYQEIYNSQQEGVMADG